MGNTAVRAGRILVFLGALHLLVLGAQNTGHLDAWFSGALWGLPREEFIEPRGAGGAFWISIGSFAVPLLLLGLLVSWLGRQGVRVPSSVGWGLAAWSAVGAVVVEPTPMLLVLVPAVLLIRQKEQITNGRTGAGRTPV
ncbi:DUF6463 family protein [Streptomyces sp. NBC_01481]|uniref:DUF6463 family protein n=1 Tax=Streptomyces sp. NBC_01481 TaxID=2975869 RepID=UPI00225A693F|nr:DUF6463 family protein [Streptomyces sp. NBC_01481]MCX4583913.1 DUF6463 family protein [Streptomyces sp. NBC_01481]